MFERFSLSGLRRPFSGSKNVESTAATRPGGGRDRSPQRRRKLLIEQLETRLPLAAPTDLAAISGRVFVDINGDGFTAGEEVAGATVNLFRDNGDGIFNPATDTPLPNATSGPDGRYQFNNVTAGNYFVRQPSQNVAGRSLQESVSPLIALTASDVAGSLFTVIDSFDAAAQLVFDDTNDGVPVTSSIQGPTAEILGGERDLLVNKTSLNGRVQISVNDPLLPGFLSFDSIQTGQGQRIVSWDGIDGDAAVLNDAGLGNVDLTSGGTATGLRLETGADSAAGTATIRIFTDDGVAGTSTRFSTGVVQIPDTGGVASSLEFLPFSAFTATSGGGADFTRVGAIELEITGAANVNGAANLVGAIGPTVRTADFNNRNTADLSLAMTVDNANPGIGDDITFTLTVRNAGPLDAGGITLRNTLPTGLSFVSSNPSQGNFNSATGIWNVGAVAASGQATLQLVARVNSVGTLVNTAEITASNQPDPNSTPGNNIATEDDQASVSIAVMSADLSLTKTASNASPNVGTDVTFTVTVRNAGPNAATGVTVLDRVPTGMTFVSASSTPETPSGNYDSATGIWTVGALAVNGQATLRIIATPVVAGQLTNTAEVATSDQNDPNSTPGNNVPGEDDQASVIIVAQQSDLSLTKAVDNPTPNRGQTIVFTTTLSNAGPSNATNIQVRDLLPAGLTLQSSNPSVGSYNATNGIWTLPTLATGSNATLRLTAVVNTVDPATSTAEVIAVDQPDPNSRPGNNDPAEDDQASVTITVPAANLSLTNVPETATPNVGDTIRFTVTINNDGPNIATGVAASAILPSGLTFVSATPSQGTFTSATGRWTVGSINPAANATLNLFARVTTTGAKSVRAEVIEADQVDPNSTPGNNVEAEDDQQTAVVTPQVIDLSLAMNVNRPRPLVGQDVTFTLTLANAGPNTATNISVRNMIPNGMTFVSANPSVGAYSAATGLWTLPSLAASANATLQLVASFDAPQVITNTAEVFAVDQFDSDSTPNNNVPTEDDQASVVLEPATADLSLRKIVDNAEPNLGDTVTFTITVSNAGPDVATGVSVLDQLPAGLAFVSATPSIGNYNAVSGIWTIGEIGVGVNRTLLLVATAMTPGPKVNVARVETADQFDPDSTPGNNVLAEDDQDAITVTPQLIDLSLTKTINNASPNVGQNVTYVLTLTNAGPSTATGVTVLDRLNAGVSLVSATATNGNYVAATGVWTVGPIAAGAAARLTIIAQVIQVGTFINTAEVMTANQPDINSTPGNGDRTEDDFAFTAFTTPVADLSITNVVDNPTPDRNETVTFTVQITNSGPDNATGIVVTNRIASNFNFTGSTATAGIFTPTAGTWVIPTLASGANATLTISGRARNFTPITSTAEITRADQSDPDSIPGNADPAEDDIATVVVTPNAIDLSVTGAIDNLKPVVGDIVTLTYTVTNSGQSTATGVELTALLPPGVTTIVSGTTQGIYAPATGLWVVGTLLPGETETLTIELSVDTAGIRQVRFQVTAADQFDIDSTPNNDIEAEDDQVTVAINAPRLFSVRLFLAR